MSPSVVCDRLKVWHKCQTFTNRSGSGDSELQRKTKTVFFYRIAGACPPRSLHGEGQALALRKKGGVRVRQ